MCDENNEVQLCPLTWEEENALHYVDRYVCRKVQCEINKSSLAHKELVVRG